MRLSAMPIRGVAAGRHAMVCSCDQGAAAVAAAAEAAITAAVLAAVHVPHAVGPPLTTWGAGIF